MGFSSVAIKFPEVMTTTFLLTLLFCAKFLIVALIRQLRLFTPSESEAEQANSEGEPMSMSTRYVYAMDWSSPSVIPIRVHVVTALIKKNLQVVEYGNSIKTDASNQVEATQCTICLDNIDRAHEIRQLGNCCHVFHRECLDDWIDAGWLTCPLCRSLLLPAKGDRTKCEGDTLMFESIGEFLQENQLLGVGPGPN